MLAIRKLYLLAVRVCLLLANRQYLLLFDVLEVWVMV